MTTKKTTIITDLDGTLCDSRHREHLAQAKDWDAFHSKSIEDNPDEAVKHLIKLYNGWGMEILAITGRPERYRNQTMKWLLTHDIHIDTLLMRPNDDFSSDTACKPKLLRQHYADIHREEIEKLPDNSVDPLFYAVNEVLFILEDRDIMTEEWRNLGFTCWQVRQGGY